MKDIFATIVVYATVVVWLWFGYIEGVDGPRNLFRLYVGLNLVFAVSEAFKAVEGAKLAEALKGRGETYLQVIGLWWLLLSFFVAWYGAWFATICTLTIMVLRIGVTLEWREKLEKFNKEQNEAATR